MNEKETGKSPADIAGDIRVIETDISHIKGDISELKDGLKSQGKDISDLRSELKDGLKAQGEDIADLKSELKARGNDIAGLRYELKDRGDDIAGLKTTATELQLGQTEIKTMIGKILATLPEKVEKQGQKISWLFGLVAGLSLMVTIIAVVLRN